METIQVYCNWCKQTTNHSILKEYKNQFNGDEEIGEIIWEYFQIIGCNGCNVVSYRSVIRITDDFDPNTNTFDDQVTLYPKRVSRNPIENYGYFPTKCRKIYLETLEAINNELQLLTSIGLRSLIESICIEQNLKFSNLAEGINNLKSNGLLSEKQCEILHNHRFIGNNAAHKFLAPELPNLIIALDIAETLLKTIYILPKMSKEIESPKRKK